MIKEEMQLEEIMAELEEAEKLECTEQKNELTATFGGGGIYSLICCWQDPN